jgi:hypothetical protein
LFPCIFIRCLQKSFLLSVLIVTAADMKVNCAAAAQQKQPGAEVASAPGAPVYFAARCGAGPQIPAPPTTRSERRRCYKKEAHHRSAVIGSIC